MRFKNVFWSKTSLDSAEPTGFATDILAVGDSWFWYPMPGGSLINFVGELVGPKGHNILVSGNNGADVFDYVEGKFKSQVSEMLRLYGSTASALLVSGGFNDFGAFSATEPLFKPDCSAETTAAGCFKPGNAPGTLTFMLDGLEQNYHKLTSRFLAVAPNFASVVLHCYDYSIPDGRGLFGPPGWLKPNLDASKVPLALQADCIKQMIDGLLQRQLAVAAAQPRVKVIDSRGTLVHAEWANELHPTAEGFMKLAQQRWQPTLAALGLA